MSLYERFVPNGPTGFGYGTTADQVTEGLSLKGTTVLLTGCNAGLGLETLKVLTRRGAKVVGTARSFDKAKGACATAGGDCVPLACDLADPVSVRACVAEVKRIGVTLDALICNAGIMALPKREQACGYELQFFTNHIGHFILVTGLLDALAEKGRVVMLSSDAHTRAPRGGIEFDNLSGERGYSPWRAYGQSKFANLLFAKELARRFAGTKKTANAVHPGVIHTALWQHLPGVVGVVAGMGTALVLKSVEQGAATALFAAVHPKAAGISGEFLKDCNVAKPRQDATDPALAKRLWEESEKIVARV